ncbi:MAG: TonB-dependent receptor, plug, partial [Bryobacterales bacterium]|nr:TonB-dependent receptor, plug [Bryobacterales bacterium]
MFATCAMRVVVAGFLLSCLAFGQFDSGQISGFVRDETGALIPGASITAVNEGTGEQHKTTSGPQGYYIFPQLVVGKYSVTMEAAGFKKFLQKGVVLDAQAKLGIDAALPVGSLTEQIEVLGSAAQVQTDTAQVGSLIDNKQIQNLTLNGRNPIYLAALTPGVVGSQGIGTFDPDSVSNGGFNINGGRADEYVVVVDGAV